MGNVLMGDDAAGPYAVAVFSALYQVPGSVTVLDIGTPGLDLAPHLADADVLILVDTVYSDAVPGAIRAYDKAALLGARLPPRLSPHDPAVGQCLASLEIAGCGPRELLLLGIVPQQTSFGPGLSAALQNAIPAVVDRIADELRAWGVSVEPRSIPAIPDLWWEAPVLAV
jgi:hydrogenase maturation protease